MVVKIIVKGEGRCCNEREHWRRRGRGKICEKNVMKGTLIRDTCSGSGGGTTISDEEGDCNFSREDKIR